MKYFSESYHDLISTENISLAWSEFVRGKKKKKDIKEFQNNLINNITKLHEDLNLKKYKHGSYIPFKISDPKPREIHKASVRDRLMHHVLYRKLYQFFDQTWIADSYSCRNDKGTHRAMNRFKLFFGQVSKNNTRTCWVLKCDIKKFFASIDQKILLEIISKYIPDKNIVEIIEEIVHSFHSKNEGIGLPLGNLTSQLLVNIYMNKFDQYAKHNLKCKHYIRYADDFVILSEDKKFLENILPEIEKFLNQNLNLSLHPDKVYIKTFASGIDFLGWIHFPRHRVLRTASKKRMFRNLKKNRSNASIQSYKGFLSHGNAHKLSTSITCVGV